MNKHNHSLYQDVGIRYGFIIDQRKCIGCHACTVACKAENNVALGTFRTWVKYTEKGTFPAVTRSFLVERCNHCDDAPCVAICPVTALWRRDDGIVDFSGERCIGCKACMAACPYDAIYIDPNSHTIGKCNFCAHRVDLGLQPACVNVCPVEAIITGDLDDPHSHIAQLLSHEPVAVRRPEKGTKPKLFYLGADVVALDPAATAEQRIYMMAETAPGKPARISTPIGIVPTGMVQRDYSVAHERPWSWPVSAYLWTKSLAAGIFLLAATLALGGASNASSVLTVLAPALALFFLALTGLFLVYDLERPERFVRVLLWPHWTSWLVIGAYIITIYSGVVSVAFAIGVARTLGVSGLTKAEDIVLGIGAVLALPTAGYTAFLLAQAKGRDLWQSPLLLPQLIVQAIVCGASILTLLSFGLDRAIVVPMAAILAVSLGLSMFLIIAEVTMPHVTVHTRQAIHNMTRGEAAVPFWLGVLLLGIALPLVLAGWAAAGGSAVATIPAAVLALAGVAVYEDMYIRAGQSVPLS